MRECKRTRVSLNLCDVDWRKLVAVCRRHGLRPSFYVRAAVMDAVHLDLDAHDLHEETEAK